jgi:hypothetical protein
MSTGSYIRYLGPGDDDENLISSGGKVSRFVEIQTNLTEENFIENSGIIALLSPSHTTMIGSEIITDDNIQEFVFNNAKMFFFCQL